MDITRTIKKILTDKGLGINEFAHMIDRSPQTIYNMFYRQSVSCRTLETWLDALNCDLAIIDRETGEIYE